MPLPLALLVAFALGAAFAYAAKGELARHDGPLLTSRAAILVGAFAALVFAPITGYFAAFHGDWTYLYVVSWQSVPSAVDLALVVLSGVIVVVGFLVGAPAARAPSVRGIALLVAVPSAVALLLLALFARRLLVSASYAQFHGAFGVEPIASSALGKGVVWAIAVLTAGVLWTFRSIRASA